MQRWEATSPLFLSFAGNELEPIVTANNAAVKYLRREQFKIANVMASRALNDLKKYPITIQSKKTPRYVGNAIPPGTPLHCSDNIATATTPRKAQLGFLIRDSGVRVRPQYIELILLYNLGLTQQLQATSDLQFKKTISIYKSALKAISIPHASGATHSATTLAYLARVHVDIWLNLSKCFAEVGDEDQADGCYKQALQHCRSDNESL